MKTTLFTHLPVREEHANFFLEPLPCEIAARIFQSEVHIVDEDTDCRVPVYDEQAQKLATSQGCNPKVKFMC
jgi:hypothetical protein